MTAGFDLDRFRRAYDLDTRELTINDRRFSFFVPASIDRFIDPDDPMADFPLWAKIWEASGVLASIVADIAPDPGHRVLEIGAGLGVVGTVAAGCGHKVTITEYAEPALDFIRANLAANGVDAQVRRLDWNRDDLQERFDLILASEVVFRPTDIEPICDLLARHLAPDGRALLAESFRQTGKALWETMARRFRVQARKFTLRSQDGQQTPVAVFTIRHPGEAV